MSEPKKCFDHIAKLVQEARESIGISQEELSLNLGYKNGQFISNIERGKCSLPIKHICLFCQLTKTETDPVIKAILYDQQMTINGVVFKTEKRKMVKFRIGELIK